MPFPFKKKSVDEPGMPESPEMPMRKPPARATAAPAPAPDPEETPEGEVSGHADKIVAEGEKYGLNPEESKAFAKYVLQCCAEGLGGEDEATEGTGEGDTENYSA